MTKKKSSSGHSSNGGLSSEAVGFSGFGGHSLVAVQEGVGADAGGGVVASLAELGVEDAEQLMGLVAVPEAEEELKRVLGPETNRLSDLIKQAERMIPEDRRAELSKPAERDLGLGALVPTEEMEAAAVQADDGMVAAEPIALPGAINLIPYMSPIRNQASRGTCVAFALTSLNEYCLRRRGLIRDLSEQHLYYETKLIDGAPNSCGTWQAKAVIALRTRGQCREAIWPYNPNPPCNNHGPLPPAARPDGLIYRLNTLSVPARTVLAYKTQMAAQKPVTISIPVYNSWYLSAETRRSGRITMRIGNEPVAGGHALCLVGYQDTASSPGGGHFIVRNSWGTANWGYQCPYGAGYGTIPYQYIANDAYMGESFTAAVLGVRVEDEETDETSEEAASTVVIQVRPNVTITIERKK